MEKRGPKFKSECPIDLHLRLNEEDRDFINSLGSASAQEKVVSLIHERKKQSKKLTLTEIQTKILDLHRQRNQLTNQIGICQKKLIIEYGLTPEKTSEIIDQIESDARGE